MVQSARDRPTQQGAERSARRRANAVLGELGRRLVGTDMGVTPGAPHVRSTVNVDRLLLCLVFASIPAWLVGVYNLGYQLARAVADTQGGMLLGWQGSAYALSGLPLDAAAPFACLVLGLLYHGPLLIVALVATVSWEVLFASRRGRSVDPGWLMTAWLFALLLPATVPPGLAALAVSFGVVFGAHIFGGTGRYLLSPALLGVLFLYFSYPGFAQGGLPVSGFTATTSWTEIARSGLGGGSEAPGFVALLLGREIGAVGTGSALACMAGAGYLVLAGAASWRMLAGALLGLLVATSLANVYAGEDPVWALPWYAHLVVGNFAFGVAFLASDPSVAPLTRPARWGYGFMIGLLTLVMRVADPGHPEGSLYAILLAGLAVPFLDYLVVRRHRHQPWDPVQ